MITIRYRFKDKPICIKNAAKADPQKIGEALTAIKQKTKRFNSKAVLSAARDRSSYLHQFFEWKDSVAAEKYRQDQARELVVCIDVVEMKGKREVSRLPAFISLIERDGRRYHTVSEVMDSVDLQALALKQAENDLAAYEKRLAQFADICSAIRAARELVASRRKKMRPEDRPGA
jgi:hypothetical protein